MNFKFLFTDTKDGTNTLFFNLSFQRYQIFFSAKFKILNQNIQSILSNHY